MTITRSETAAHGIRTMYRGTRFRSRLEARWASFFDLVGWSWVYEPFDTAGWIPDFLVTGGAALDLNGTKASLSRVPAVNGSAPFLIEVGPCATEREYRAKAEKPLAAYPYPTAEDHWVTLVVGLAPHVLDDERAGLQTGSADSWGEWSYARWSICPVCSEFAIARGSIYGGHKHQPCGHTDEMRGIDPRSIADLWGQAGNEVQWRR